MLRRQADAENWSMCAALLKESGVVTWHVGHLHRRGIEPKWYEIRDDLYSNQCRQVVPKAYWVDF